MSFLSDKCSCSRNHKVSPFFWVITVKIPVPLILGWTQLFPRQHLLSSRFTLFSALLYFLGPFNHTAHFTVSLFFFFFFYINSDCVCIIDNIINHTVITKEIILKIFKYFMVLCLLCIFCTFQSVTATLNYG